MIGPLSMLRPARSILSASAARCGVALLRLSGVRHSNGRRIRFPSAAMKLLPRFWQVPF